jgi:hypothetical protein
MSMVRAIALFCEDIREEKSGQDILIGILSDNLGLPSLPAVLGKLAVYVRVYFDTSAKPKPIIGWVQLPWGQKFDLGEASTALVKQALEDAKSQGNPLAGVVLKGMFTPLPVPTFGVITAFIKIGEQEHLCGFLNLTLAEPANPSGTESPPQT